MASYLILEPASGPDKDHATTRFVRDGFSLVAFIIPGVWLLWHRLWLFAIGAFLVEGIGFELAAMNGFWPAGAALLLGVHILTAIEGQWAYGRHLQLAGWKETALVSAHDVSEAEELYFSSLPPEEKKDMPKPNWDIRAQAAASGAAMGLIGYDGGRA